MQKNSPTLPSKRKATYKEQKEYEALTAEIESLTNEKAELEQKLPTVDKSTLFRTLGLLSENHLLDTIDDGSGSQKYCIRNPEDPQSEMKHVHFNCRICHQTVCLTEVTLPEVTLPSGYTVEDTEYVVKGVCPKCAGK